MTDRSLARWPDATDTCDAILFCLCVQPPASSSSRSFVLNFKIELRQAQRAQARRRDDAKQRNSFSSFYLSSDPLFLGSKLSRARASRRKLALFMRQGQRRTDQRRAKAKNEEEEDVDEEKVCPLWLFSISFFLGLHNKFHYKIRRRPAH